MTFVVVSGCEHEIMKIEPISLTYVENIRISSTRAQTLQALSQYGKQHAGQVLS